MFADTDVHAGCNGEEERPDRHGKSAELSMEVDIVKDTEAAR